MSLALRDIRGGSHICYHDTVIIDQKWSLVNFKMMVERVIVQGALGCWIILCYFEIVDQFWVTETHNVFYVS